MTPLYGMLAQISSLKADYLNYCRVQNAAKFFTSFWKARDKNYIEAENTRDKVTTSANGIQDDIRI